jgi:hypothetical protein
MDTAAVDAYIRLTTQTPTPSLQPPLLPPLLQLAPTPVVTRHQSRLTSPLLSPAPSHAFTWQPSWQPARPPTPYHEPESPPTPLPTYSPHRDITYQHSVSAAAQQSSSAPAPAPLAQWRQAQAEEAARPIVPTPWQVFKWGTTEDNNQEPEPWGRAPVPCPSLHPTSPRTPMHTRSAHRPPATTTLNPRSSFRGGTTVIATASARDPSNSDPVAILPILVGLDSYSDVTVTVTVAAPEFVYNKRQIMESFGTGAGTSEYFEEGFIDIALLPHPARSRGFMPHHLPSSCSLLLGVPQLNELDILLDVHKKQRKLATSELVQSGYHPRYGIAARMPPVGNRFRHVGRTQRVQTRRFSPLLLPRHRRQPRFIYGRTSTNKGDQRAFSMRT